MRLATVISILGLGTTLISATVQADVGQVMDVFVLAGQSNMVGGARVEDLPKSLLQYAELNSEVTTRTWLNGDEFGDEWVPLQPRGSGQNFGPEMMLGHVLSDVHQDRNIAFMKIAYNGTNLGCSWHPDGCGQHLFAEMVSLIDQWQEELETLGWSVRFAGFIWVQGEADCTAEWSSDSYGSNLQLLIDGVRSSTGNADLPAVVAKVAPLASSFPYVEMVHRGMESVSKQDAKVGTVTCEAYELKNDQVHFSAAAMIMLGGALADTLLALDPFEITEEEIACQSDINGDGDVNVLDILLMISDFGPCP